MVGGRARLAGSQCWEDAWAGRGLSATGCDLHAEPLGCRAMHSWQSDLSLEAIDGCAIGIDTTLELVGEITVSIFI